MRQLKLTLIALLCSATVLFGQSLERQVIGNAGMAIQTASGGISFTVSQQATFSSILSSAKLTQGFQQVDPSEFVGVLDLKTITTTATVFPNPTVNTLTLKSNLMDDGIFELNYSILDLHAKVVFVGNVSADGGSIDVSSLAASTYTLVLQSDNMEFNQKIRFIKM